MGAAITETTLLATLYGTMGSEQMKFLCKQVWDDVRKQHEEILNCSADGKERLGPVGTTSRSATSIQLFAVCQFPQNELQLAEGFLVLAQDCLGRRHSSWWRILLHPMFTLFPV